MAALNDLSFFAQRSLGGIGAEEVDTPRAQALLAELRKYDPAATFKPAQLGESGQTSYTLSFDGSKIPGYDPNSLTITGEGFNGRPMSWGDQLKDPSAVIDSGLFGQQTKRTNIKPEPMSTLDWLGPALVGAFGFGIPYVAAAMTGGSAGAGGAAAGATALDTAGDAYLGLGSGFPEMQAVGYPALDTSGDVFLGLDGASGAAPITDLSSPARVGDVIRNGGIPGIDNIVQSAREISPTSLLKAGAKAAGSLVGPAGTNGGLLSGGGGGGGLLGGGGSPYEDSMSILARYYGIPQDMLRKAMKGTHA